MDELKLKQTSFTPEIYFHKNGNLEISGKVIPDLEIDFWTPLKDWINDYVQKPAAKTILRLQIDCLNTSSSREILELLYKLNDLNDRGFQVSVYWIYNYSDLDMLEAGRDYEQMVKIPFVFSANSEISYV
jgi:hypothetical protein